jgi:hypothetical protein
MSFAETVCMLRLETARRKREEAQEKERVLAMRKAMGG